MVYHCRDYKGGGGARRHSNWVVEVISPGAAAGEQRAKELHGDALQIGRRSDSN